jgi:antitoxin HicB
MAVQEILLSLDVQRLPEGGWLATSDEVPGLVAQGRTIAETLEIAQDVARKLAGSFIEHGDPLPVALQHEAPEHFTLRLPVGAI